MNNREFSSLDRHALVMALWLGFAFLAVTLLKLGIEHVKLVGPWLWLCVSARRLHRACLGQCGFRNAVHAEGSRSRALGFCDLSLVVRACGDLLSTTPRWPVRADRHWFHDADGLGDLHHDYMAWFARCI